MSFTATLGLGTLVFTFVNFLKYGREWLGSGSDQASKTDGLNGVLTQVIAWIAGIAGVLIAAQTQFAPQIKFGSQTLSTMDWETKIFLGLIATSLLSTINEVKKAIDNKDSATTPTILTGKRPTAE